MNGNDHDAKARVRANDRGETVNRGYVSRRLGWDSAESGAWG
jgi:hypothetical protein